MVTAPCLFLPYLRMLHGLCCSRSAAGLCFSLLKANATNPGTCIFHVFNLNYFLVVVIIYRGFFSIRLLLGKTCHSLS